MIKQNLLIYFDSMNVIWFQGASFDDPKSSPNFTLSDDDFLHTFEHSLLSAIRYKEPSKVADELVMSKLKWILKKFRNSWLYFSATLFCISITTSNMIEKEIGYRINVLSKYIFLINLTFANYDVSKIYYIYNFYIWFLKLSNYLFIKNINIICSFINLN